MTTEQQRCAFLAFRCEHGFDRRDKGRTNPISEEKAIQEWDELLRKRFPQPNSGGRAFVLKIMRIVKNMKTDSGLDLFDKPAILQHLAKWSKEMCQLHNINPGSEVMHALEQQLHWHEENLEEHQITRTEMNEGFQKVLEAMGQVNKSTTETNESIVAETDNVSVTVDTGNVSVTVQKDDEHIDTVEIHKEPIDTVQKGDEHIDIVEIHTEPIDTVQIDDEHIDIVEIHKEPIDTAETNEVNKQTVLNDDKKRRRKRSSVRALIASRDQMAKELAETKGELKKTKAKLRRAMCYIHSFAVEVVNTDSPYFSSCDENDSNEVKKENATSPIGSQLKGKSFTSSSYSDDETETVEQGNDTVDEPVAATEKNETVDEPVALTENDKDVEISPWLRKRLSLKQSTVDRKKRRLVKSEPPSSSSSSSSSSASSSSASSSSSSDNKEEESSSSDASDDEK